MRLFLNNLIFLILFCWPLSSEEIRKNYVVKVSGIKIGELSWGMKVTTNNYSNTLSLKSKGLLSGLYNFKGDYFSEGNNRKNELFPKNYKHFWQTKKTVKKMELSFKKNRLAIINQEPVEEEKIRLNVFNIENTHDPLTSFLKQKTHKRKDEELLIEMVFQMGVKKVLMFKNLLSNMKKNDKHLVCFEMMNSLWYTQTPNRVKSLIKVLLNNER